MKISRSFFAVCLLISLWPSFLHGQTGHQVKMVAGSTNNQLEVLDWGGTGPAILFLSALGNSAHVYDTFAPRFTDRYRVFALTRRGCGSSEQTKTGYDIETLVDDILAVIDTLRLDKVILIGHLFAGDEITTLATWYPRKVSAAIYIEAAFDHSRLDKLPLPADPEATTTDSSSLENFNKYIEKIRGLKLPEDDLKHQYAFSGQGKLGAAVTRSDTRRAMLQGVKIPNYKGVVSRTLAIYGQFNTAADYFHSYPYLDPESQQKAVKTLMPVWNKYYEREISRFRDEIPNGTVKQIPATTRYLFLTNPDETEKLIRDFLGREKS